MRVRVERVRAGWGGLGGAEGQGEGKETASKRETESLSVCDVALDTSATKIQDDAHTHVSLIMLTRRRADVQACMKDTYTTGTIHAT